MSLESRVRRELHGAADGLRADVEGRLGSTFRVAARRRTTRRAGAVLALAVALAAGGIGGPLALDALTSRRAPGPAAPAPIPAALVGVYERTVSSSEAPNLPGLAGRFELRLGADGRLDLIAPRAFVMGNAPAKAYEVRDDVLISTAYFDHCGERMAYFWAVNGDVLLLSATAEEPCPYRRVVFTGGPWTRIAPSP